ncbi:MAG TPA: winged helix-turn-helix domain-containing protein [Acidobacteriaceae bacterium]
MGSSSASRLTDSPIATYRFGPFRFDPTNRLLSRDGDPIALAPRAFDTLLVLVERAGQLVTKTELLDIVWADSFVEESNLTVAISALRRALGEDPYQRKYIQTVSGHGYRFICPVLTGTTAEAEASHVGEGVSTPSSQAVTEPTISKSAHAQPDTASAEASPQDAEPARADAAGVERAPSRFGLWIWAAVAAVAVIALVSWRLYVRHAERFEIHTLAVLPIRGTGVNDYMLLGMTDALIGKVGTIAVVRPTSSVLRYSIAPSVDAQAAGREQGADAVVVSHLSQSGNTTEIQLELIRTSDGRSLWKHNYKDQSDRTARLQETIDDGLVTELRKFVADLPAKAAPAVRPNVNDAAYQLYLRGRYFWNRRTEDGLHHSIECFRQSIAIAPNYAPAYAGLADSYALLASFSVESGRAANPDARAAALSAIQLDPTLAEPHASLGMIYFFTDWNGPAAEQEFAKAIALNPNYATAHHWYALDLAAMGRFPEALYEIRKAQTLDPLSLIISTNVGWIKYLNHQNQDAIADYRKVLELDPSFVRARTRLGIAEIRGGNAQAAVKDLEEAEKASGDPYVSGLLGEALGQSGQTAAAERVLRDLQAKSASKYVPPFSLALVDLGLNRKKDAITALKQAVDDRSTSMVYAKIDPSLDALRNDPEFAGVIAGMNF